MDGLEEAPRIPEPEEKKKKPTLCEECGSNPWKYRCPGCSLVSCSLPCVNAHKVRTGCTGKRPRTEFVPIAQFDDNLLLSDYNFLEDAKRAADAAQRMLVRFGTIDKFKLPMGLWELRKAVKRRKTDLIFLPMGMSNREKNRTRYVSRKRCVYWTMEFRFHSTDAVIIEHSISEHATLYSVVEKHLKPNPWNDQLRPFCSVELDDLKFFVRKNAKGNKSPYCKLNIRAPIRKQLQGLLILEYPVIYVFLPSQNYDFKVLKEVNSVGYVHKNEEPSVYPCSISSPKGTVFKEEEFEEGEMLSDTQVTDLLECANSVPCKKPLTHDGRPSGVEQVNHQNNQITNSLADGLESTSDIKCQDIMEESSMLPAGVEHSLTLFEDETFVFEQEVRDAYSKLLGEINPDDFLCLDGLDNVCSEDEELKFYAASFEKELLKVDELEEGEIPSY